MGRSRNRRSASPWYLSKSIKSRTYMLPWRAAVCNSRRVSSALHKLYQAGLRYWNLLSFENVADNLRESFRVIAASRPQGEVRELHGVSIASAGVTFQMFNAAFLSEPVLTEAELAQRVLLASMHFDSRGQEWAYWFCEGWLDVRARRRSRQVFERQGLRHSVDLPGMAAEGVGAPVKAPARIDVRRVSPARPAMRSARLAQSASMCHSPGFARYSTAARCGKTSRPMWAMWMKSRSPRPLSWWADRQWGYTTSPRSQATNAAGTARRRCDTR